jgi:hypothetical protein
MTRTARKGLEIDLRPAIDYLGLDFVLDQIGVDRVLEHIGLDRVLEEIGYKKVIEHMGFERILAALSPADRRELKRLLQ